MSSDRQEQISNLYRTILGREPDVDGLAWWVSTPTPIEEISKEFAKSPEAIVVRAFHVSNMFKELLGRDPDIEGFKYWVLSQASLDDMRKEFMKSEEYKILNPKKKSSTTKKK